MGREAYACAIPSAEVLPGLGGGPQRENPRSETFLARATEANPWVRAWRAGSRRTCGRTCAAAFGEEAAVHPPLPRPASQPAAALPRPGSEPVPELDLDTDPVAPVDPLPADNFDQTPAFDPADPDQAAERAFEFPSMGQAVKTHLPYNTLVMAASVRSFSGSGSLLSQGSDSERRTRWL
jgi:hypothetical protein